MQVSNSKSHGMQEGNESSVRKVNKKVLNSKMNKSQNAATNKSSTPDNSNESPQNVRLDTSESDEESVSEVMRWSDHGFVVKFVIWKKQKNFKVKFSSLKSAICVESENVILWVYFFLLFARTYYESRRSTYNGDCKKWIYERVSERETHKSRQTMNFDLKWSRKLMLDKIHPGRLLAHDRRRPCKIDWEISTDRWRWTIE